MIFFINHLLPLYSLVNNPAEMRRPGSLQFLQALFHCHDGEILIKDPPPKNCGKRSAGCKIADRKRVKFGIPDASDNGRVGIKKATGLNC
jgi:hypothetical protein